MRSTADEDRRDPDTARAVQVAREKMDSLAKVTTVIGGSDPNGGPGVEVAAPYGAGDLSIVNPLSHASRSVALPRQPCFVGVCLRCVRTAADPDSSGFPPVQCDRARYELFHGTRVPHAFVQPTRRGSDTAR